MHRSLVGLGTHVALLPEKTEPPSFLRLSLATLGSSLEVFDPLENGVSSMAQRAWM